ncbi:MAG: O-methyltransferase [Rhodospirillaceae bacterium]|nr:O-methyltransferase [Rhodospirillaceae bacterium]
MATPSWIEIDRFLNGLFAPSDPVLEAVLNHSAAAGLPPHNVSPTQGRLLALLARTVEARRILEIGTLGGYSTIWLARALPDEGRLVTLEVEPRHAEAARANFARAGISDRIDLRLGPALDQLAQLHAEGSGPFDLVFIDADKVNNPHYLDGALKLTRRGGLIVADNVVRGGSVADADAADPSTSGVRAYLARLAAHPRLSATAIQTVGEKGHDGFAIALVTADP